MRITFTVSIERIDGKYVLCPLGSYPRGFDVGGFDTVGEAEAWLERWAESRRLALDLIQPRHWRVSYWRQS